MVGWKRGRVVRSGVLAHRGVRQDQRLRVSQLRNHTPGSQFFLGRVLDDERTVLSLELRIRRLEVRVIPVDARLGDHEAIGVRPSGFDCVLRDGSAVAGVVELHTVPVDARRLWQGIHEVDDHLITDLEAKFGTGHGSVVGVGIR